MTPASPTAAPNAKGAADQNDRLQALNDRQKDLEGRLNQAQKDADKARVSDLEKQLADVKDELASTKTNAAADLAAADRQRAHDVARAQAQAANQAPPANTKYRRVEFQVATNDTAEIAPGISVDITRTDAMDQRFSGKVFAPEGRTITLREQSANSPVVFFARNGTDRYELVIKTVKNDSVSGYVLLPTG